MKIRDILDKEKIVVLIIFITALSLRLFYTFSHKANLLDEIDPIAINIALGRGFRAGMGPLAYDESLWTAPLYPFVIALVYILFGDNYIAALVLQVIIGATSCVLIYLIAKQSFNKNVAFISALIAAFCINFIIYTAMFLTETLYIFLFLLSFYYLFKAISFKKKLDYIIAGIFAGLSALARPIIMVFYIFFFIWGLRKRFFKGILFFTIALCIVILPWIIRNYLIYHKFIPITAGGEIFWYGNHPQATGEYVAPDEIIKNRGTEKYPLLDEIGPNRQRLSFLEWESKGYREGVKFIIQNPGKFLLLSVKKMSLFWSVIRSDGWWPHIKSTFDKIASLSLLILFATFIFSFGIMGIVFSFRDRDNILKSLLRLFIIVCPLSLIPFLVEARYRLPIYPFMIIFASYSLTLLPEIKSVIKSKDKKIIPYLKISMILIAILLLNTIYDSLTDLAVVISRIKFLF